MSVDTVTVHYSKHPEVLHRSKILLDQVTILVDLPHLGYEASPGLESYLLDNISWLLRNRQFSIFWWFVVSRCFENVWRIRKLIY